MSEDRVDLTEKFDGAVAFARRTHHGQYRKGTGIPYLSHVLGVASIALEYGADEDLAIAALLHDTVEDGGGQPVLDEIRAQFGDRVADLVAGTSDDIPESPDKKRDWAQRKVSYIEHIASARDDLVLVSAADKLHNLGAIRADRRRLGPDLWTRFNAGRSGSLWYYRRLGRVPHRVPPRAGGSTRAIRSVRR